MENSDIKVGLSVGQADFIREQVALKIPEDDDNVETASLRLRIDHGNLDLALSCHGDIKKDFTEKFQHSSRSAVDIMVCTPGRLIDHMDYTPGFSLRYLEFLVIDEADKLSSQRYQNWIERVLKEAEKSAVDGSKSLFWRNSLFQKNSKTTLNRKPFSSNSSCRPVQLRKFLVSATMTRDPQKLASIGLVNPKFYDANQMTTTESGNDSMRYVLPSELKEYTVECTLEQKPIVLCTSILEFHRASCPTDISVVFTSSVEGTHRLTRLLQIIWRETRHGDPNSIAEFSSALSPKEKTTVVARCKQRAGGLRTLVCSDSMSRGIDIDTVGLVINYDMPKFAENYVHRCGRTARAGKNGKSITLLSNYQLKQFHRMRRLVAGSDQVTAAFVDKSLARSVVFVYRNCLSNLREVLEAEEHGELGRCDPLPQKADK